MYPLIHAITISRVWNFIKVTCSYFISRIFGKTFHAGMPISVAVEPTTSCNLRCTECPSGLHSFTRPEGKIDVEKFKMYIDQLKSYVFYLTLYFQGEPYLHPGLIEMIKYSRKNRIYTATSTNAHFLDPEMAEETVKSGLNRLIVSMDGTDQKAYSSYRIAGDFNKVLEGISNVSFWKKKLNSKTPFLELQFLVLRSNEHQVDEIKRLGKSLGVDKVTLKTAQVYDLDHGESLIPRNEKYSRYKKNVNGKYSIKSKLPDYCWRMWSSTVITWDGRIVPCCFDKDADHQLGTVEPDGFIRTWKGKTYQAFRKKVFSDRKQIGICNNCTEGLSRNIKP